MQEVKLKDNKTNYKLFIDDLPLYNSISKEQIDILVNAMEFEISEIIKSKEKRRSYYEASKQNRNIKVPP
jgi:hypothetical protein